MSRNYIMGVPTEAFIDRYIESYEFEGDDGLCVPNDRERVLIKDAIMGLLAEPEFYKNVIFDKQSEAQYAWPGPGPKPPKWTAPDGTIVYRSYEDYVND